MKRTQSGLLVPKQEKNRVKRTQSGLLVPKQKKNSVERNQSRLMFPEIEERLKEEEQSVVWEKCNQTCLLKKNISKTEFLTKKEQGTICPLPIYIINSSKTESKLENV